MPSVYIAGPMTGYPAYNWPAFEAAARMMRARGWEVINPTEIDEKLGHVVVTRNEFGDVVSTHTTALFDYEIILAEDMRQCRACDAIFLLPGWNHSPGALRELAAYLSTGRTQVILHEEVFVD